MRNNLIELIRIKDIEGIKKFIAEGGDINIKNNKGYTALTRAEKEGYVEIVKLLVEDVIKEQKEINSQIASNKRKKGYFADEKDDIIDLTRWNDIEGVKKLIEAGEDLNTRDIYNFTPLIVASYYGHFKMAVLLLVAGANKDLKNDMGRTALDYAKEERDRHQKIVELLDWKIT